MNDDPIMACIEYAKQNRLACADEAAEIYRGLRDKNLAFALVIHGHRFEVEKIDNIGGFAKGNGRFYAKKVRLVKVHRKP